MVDVPLEGRDLPLFRWSPFLGPRDLVTHLMDGLYVGLNNTVIVYLRITQFGKFKTPTMSTIGSD